MASPRRLSRNFTLSEFPGWQDAPEAAAARLDVLVRDFLQPLRDAHPDRWIRPTSWYRPGDPKEHGHGDAVDFVVTLPGSWTHRPADARNLFDYARENLPHKVGELLLYPPGVSTTSDSGHLHATRYGEGGRGQFLERTRTGWITHRAGAATVAASLALLLAVALALALALAK